MNRALARIMAVVLAVFCLGWQTGQTIAADVNSCKMTAHFIDVGQADSTLLEFPCGAILIDAGAQDVNYTDKLIAYLDNFFNKRPELHKTLESVIITHNHIDHTSALKDVCKNFKVKRYIDNGDTEGHGTENPNWVKDNASLENITVREITNDDVVAGGNKKGLSDNFIDPIECNNCDPNIVILWSRPANPTGSYTNPNNQSIIIRVDFGKASFLFTGDAEKKETGDMLKYYKGQSAIIDVNVYHVGHHGSENGTTEKLVKAMTPTIVVISVGPWDYGKDTNDPFNTWHYGHPRKSVLELLKKNITETRNPSKKTKAATGAGKFVYYTLKKKIYTTAADGDIEIEAKWDGSFTVTGKN